MSQEQNECPEKKILENLGSLLYSMQEVVEKEHNCSDPEERAYFQGCKDSLRKILALVRDDPSWIDIINSSPWVLNSGHRNIVEALEDSNLDESDILTQ